jgi:hypothetical protein
MDLLNSVLIKLMCTPTERVPQPVIFSVVNKIFENKFNLHVYCIPTTCNKITLLY